MRTGCARFNEGKQAAACGPVVHSHMTTLDRRMPPSCGGFFCPHLGLGILAPTLIHPDEGRGYGGNCPAASILNVHTDFSAIFHPTLATLREIWTVCRGVVPKHARSDALTAVKTVEVGLARFIERTLWAYLHRPVVV